MKDKFLLGIILLASTLSFGQIKLEPSILILSPNETKYEEDLERDIHEYNTSLDKSKNTLEAEKYLQSEDFLSQPDNIRQIVESEIAFAENVDFFKNVSLISQQFLAYRFIEKFPNLLITLKDQKSEGTLNDLKGLSKNNKFQYILNFPKIELYEKGDTSYAEIRIQLFDRISSSIILDRLYTGDWNNPGFEFTCINQSIGCTINNALSKGLNDIAYTIASNSPILKKEKQLAQERQDILFKEYLNKDFDEQFIDLILTENNEQPYQLLLNNNKTKFVAFYVKQVSSQSLEDLTENKEDENVKIISPNKIEDEMFLDEIPRTYAYIIAAVRHNEKWYCEKSGVTYFHANSINEGKKKYFNNLQQWGFFKENSTEFNPSFWETHLFEKVPDLKKDPDWDKYGHDMWLSDEINDRDYVDLYKIVASTLRAENRKENLKFENRIKEQVFSKSYQKLRENHPDDYSSISEHSLIYSKNRKLAINPVLITNKEGNNTIHYFVAFDEIEELYEWVYFKPVMIEGNLFGHEVVEQISSVTNWNFSVDNLNNNFFWDRYVLLKDGKDYKYLKKVQE